MFLMFILTFGTAVAVNAYYSNRSKDQALKLTAFLLATDFGASLGIQAWSSPPDRQVWQCLLNIFILGVYVANRHLYATKPFLRNAIPLGYFTMIGMIVMYLATHGASERLSEDVTDVIYLVLLGVNLISGVRNASSGVGNGDVRGDHHLRPSRSDSSGDR